MRRGRGHETARRAARWLIAVVTALGMGSPLAMAQNVTGVPQIPGLALPFDPGGLAALPPAAMITGRMTGRFTDQIPVYDPVTDGMVFVLGLSAGGQDEIGAGMHPVSRLGLQRGRPDPILGGAAASRGGLSREARAVVDDYRIQSSPLTSVVGNVAALGASEAPMLNLSPPDQLRYEQLSARLTELSVAELAELQELYRRGFGNPDPGTPGVPSRVPAGLPGGPLVVDADTLATGGACQRVADNALLCAYLDPQNPSWNAFCTCN